MEKILQKINLGTPVQRFKDKRIDPEAVIALTDQDLVRLGVQTIGDRVRLQTLCQKKVTETQNSPSLTSAILQERSTLFSLASTSRRSSGSKKKSRTAPKRPWTVHFVCLADRLTTTVPTAAEKQILHKAGLGLKKIKLDLEDDKNAVKEKLLSDVEEGTRYLKSLLYSF